MDATDVLLKSGAGIYEINAIRRHISQTNGGMLAKRIQAAGAELIGFGISDAVGNPPTGDIGIPYRDYASTPIGPDKTTLADARRVIADYDLADRLPRQRGQLPDGRRRRSRDAEGVPEQYVLPAQHACPIRASTPERWPRRWGSPPTS